MATILKPAKHKTSISPRHTSKNSLNSTLKRQVFQLGLCLSVLVLSFSTTSFALAFVDLGPNRRVIDIAGRTTRERDIESIERSVDTINDYLRQAQDFYRNISRKNVPGTIRQVESILGELGIINPRKYPQTINDVLVGTIGDNPATTPERIYAQQQVTIDTANSDQFWIYTDAVLGDGDESGQSRLQKMNETNVESVGASLNEQENSLGQSQSALEDAEFAQNASTQVEQIAQQAKKRHISQDVFKDVAAQQAELASSNSAIANQLATLSSQQAIAAKQVSGLATQSLVSNQHLSELRVGQSIGNIQLHDIFNNQRHANQMEVMERQKNAQLAIGSTDAIYIPGLFSEPAASTK